MSDTTEPQSPQSVSQSGEPSYSSVLGYFSAWDIRVARILVILIAAGLRYFERFSDLWTAVTISAAFLGPAVIPFLRAYERWKSGSR